MTYQGIIKDLSTDGKNTKQKVAQELLTASKEDLLELYNSIAEEIAKKEVNRFLEDLNNGKVKPIVINTSRDPKELTPAQQTKYDKVVKDINQMNKTTASVIEDLDELVEALLNNEV